MRCGAAECSARKCVSIPNSHRVRKGGTKTLAGSASVFLGDDLSALVRETRSGTYRPADCSSLSHAHRVFSSCQIITRGSHLVHDSRRMRSRFVSERKAGSHPPGGRARRPRSAINWIDECCHRHRSRHRYATGRRYESRRRARRSDPCPGTGDDGFDGYRAGGPGCAPGAPHASVTRVTDLTTRRTRLLHSPEFPVHSSAPLKR
jgi:hypothetical protein